MNFFTQFFVFFLISNLIVCDELKCQKTECDCVDGENYQCPRGTTDIVINIVKNGILDLDCNRTFGDYEEWFFPKLDLPHIKTFGMRNCPNPIAGYGELLADTFNITSVQRLEIEDPQSVDKTLTKGHFSKLPFLTRLRFNAPDMQYEDDFLANLPNLTELFLYHNNFTEINIVFKLSPKLTSLDLSRNKIISLKDDLFNGLDNLKTLSLYSNRLTMLQRDVFRNLPNLNSLELSFNRLHSIAEDAFVSLGNLSHLSLAMNNLTFLSQNLFRNNTMLKSLRLGHNPLHQLSDAFFASFKQLQEINLSNTSLVNLPEKLFQGGGNLEQLRLDNNAIETLRPNVFASLGNLTYLSLNGNRLGNLTRAVFSPLKKLKILYMNRNLLTHVVNEANEGVFSTLDNVLELYLSHNRIKEIGNSFHLNRKLEKLDLSMNLISSLPNFGDGSLTLNLDGNRIGYFDLDKFNASHMQGTITLDVSDNPIECNCGNYAFLKYLKSNEERLEIQSLNALKCKKPARLEGRRFATLSLSTLVCDIGRNDASCPEKCACQYRIHDKAYIVDCSYRNLTEIPTFNLLPIANQTILNLKGNLIERVPVTIQNRTEFRNVTVLDLSENRLADFEWFPAGIRELYLDNNKLSRMKNVVIERLKKSTTLKTLYLANNPWKCDCSNVRFYKFLQLTRIVDTNRIFCANSKNLVQDAKDICPSYGLIYLSVAFSIILIIVVCFALFFRYEQEIKVWLYAKNLLLWLVTEEELDKDKQFDVFVSFSHKDEDFVAEKLLPELESGPNPYSVCVHSRNWVPGEFISTQLTRSVVQSRRTLVVLSNHFVDSVWGKMEFRTAHTEAIREGRARVIILIFGDLNEDLLDEELKMYLKTNTYIKWGDPYFWNKLRYALPHRKSMRDQQRLQNIMLKIDDKFEVKGIVGDNMSNGNQLETPPAEGAIIIQ